MKLLYVATFAVLNMLTVSCGKTESKRGDSSFQTESCLEQGTCGVQDIELLAQQTLSIVQKNCVQCHSANDPAGGVALDSIEDLERFGQSVVDVGLGRRSHPSVASLPLSEADQLTLETWEKESYALPDGLSEVDLTANPGGSDITSTTQTTGFGGKFKSCLCKFLKFWNKSKYEKYCSSYDDPGKNPGGDPFKDPYDDPDQGIYEDPVKDPTK